MKNLYPLPFINEMLNIVIGHEVYSFLCMYFKYHQIFIALEYSRHKTLFMMDWGVYIWKVMSFGVKSGPLTYKKY